MRILFDHGTPTGLSEALAGHDVTAIIGVRDASRASVIYLIPAPRSQGILK